MNYFHSKTIIMILIILNLFPSISLVAEKEKNRANKVKGDIMKPSIGLADKTRKEITQRLNSLLSDEYVLYVKTLNYHWNVVGPFWNDLHLFFGKQYAQLALFIDDIAERARTLGSVAVGSMQGFIDHARIKEESQQ